MGRKVNVIGVEGTDVITEPDAYPPITGFTGAIERYV